MSKINILKTTLGKLGTDLTLAVEYELLLNETEARLDMGFVVTLYVKPSAEMVKNIDTLDRGRIEFSRPIGVIRSGGTSRVTRTESFSVAKSKLFAAGIDVESVFNNANAGLDLRMDATPEPCAAQTAVADQRLPYSGPTMAMQFDGVNNCIEVRSSFPIEAASTVEFWARSGPQATHALFATSILLTDRVLSVHLPYTDGNVYFDKGGDKLSSGTTSYDRICKQIESGYNQDTWNHWAFVCDNAAGRMAIYRNGVLWHEAASGKIRSARDCVCLMIGADGTGMYKFQGAMTEFRLWCVARSEADIKANMNRRIPAGDSGLIASYSLDSIGTVSVDRSGWRRAGSPRGPLVLVPGPPSLTS